MSHPMGTPISFPQKWSSNPALVKLVEILEGNSVISKEEKEEVLSLITEGVEVISTADLVGGKVAEDLTSPYSPEELKKFKSGLV